MTSLPFPPIRPVCAADQIDLAEQFGADSFKHGVDAVPAFDGRLLELLGTRQVGETPTGEASTADIFAAWSRAWHFHNLTTSVKES